MRNRSIARAVRAVLAPVAAGALAAGALVAPAPASAKPVESTLLGDTDPTFDAVYRHALGVLGMRAGDRTVPRSLVRWLRDQQCDDGSFTSFRADPSAPCPAFDPTTFTGGMDTNATAVAAQALLAAGPAKAGRRAALALLRVQQPDGGWEYTPGAGFGSDPNSTGLALTALRAAGLTPRHDAVGYLAELQVGRTIDPLEPGDEGGISTPWSGGGPDLRATSQATAGVLGLSLVGLDAPPSWTGAPRTHDATPPVSAAGVGGWAAAWLAAQDQAGSTSASDLAWTVLSLAADLTGKDAAEAAYTALRTTVADDTNPGSIGQAALAARVLGRTGDARAFARRAAATAAAPARARLTKPAKKRVRVKQVRRLRGTVEPGDYGVDEVCVVAAQRWTKRTKNGAKRPKSALRWRSYEGDGKWRKRGSRKAALDRAERVCVKPSGTGASTSSWKVRLPGARAGRVVVRWYATDEVAARSGTSKRVLTVKPKSKRGAKHRAGRR